MPFEGNPTIDMSVRAEDNDKKGKKNKPEQDSNQDQNGVPKELWPFRDEMAEWAKQHLDTIGTFLEYKNARFNLIFGMGFYHAPGQDIISLSVPEYKKYRENTGMSIEQIMFGMLHEFAHLKTMIELDRAGKHNEMAHFKYEGRKRIRDKENPEKMLSLHNTYRHYYNILEDAIVNHLVKQTAHFGENVSPERAREIKDAYIEQLFVLYKEVGQGNGEYAEVENPTTGAKEIKKVGEGKGNLAKLTAEDYEEGVDFTKVKPKMDRAGQFLTFFIKNQMLGLDEDDIRSSANPNGKFVVHEDVAMALNGNLEDTYETLLQKVLEKYGDNPAQLKRYIEFMTTTVKVARFEETKGKINEVQPDFQNNVMNVTAVPELGRIYRDYSDNPHEFARRMNDFFDDLTADQVNVKRAKIQYKATLQKVIAQVGIERKADVSFLDIFEEFKSHTKSKRYSWTFPLEHNLAERGRMTRQALEPIFTMLCILDDSFDVTMPPEQGEGEGEGSGESGDPDFETPTWSEGDKVRNDNKKSPNYGKKGIISRVTYGADGKPVSVTVEYFEDNEKSAMAGSVDFSTDIEEVFEPDKNLKIIGKKDKSKGESQQSPPDKRKKEFEDEDDESDDEDQEEQEADSSEQESQETDQESGDTDLEQVMNPLQKALEQMIEQDEREANLKELEEAKKTDEYKERKYDKEKIKKLLEALDEVLPEEKSEDDDKYDPWGSRRELDNESVVKDFIELEKQIRPYADKMAKNWLEIVNNIASRIEVLRDKYYRSGKMDIRRLQKHFPEIEMGVDVDNRLLYEQFIEKVLTELRPKMLRMVLAIDNSGSMSGKVNQMRMAIMLLNASLRSFRILFRDKMRDVLGDSAPENLDIICDTQLWLFGNENNARIVKDFDVQDLLFLDDDEAEKPQIDIDAETIATLLAFKKINTSEGTYDFDLWLKMLKNHNDPELKRLIKENKLSEVVIQVCDGGFLGHNKEANENLAAFKGETGIGVGGFAIGGSEGDNEAFDALSQRHGAENVIRANTPQQIVESFSKLLKQIIADKVEKSMQEILDKLEN